jgi:hypothetical protein
MSLWTIIGQVFGRAPDAVKPSIHINPKDATLWHSVTYRSPPWKPFCYLCQKEIPPGCANTLCEEAVRERNALYD